MNDRNNTIVFWGCFIALVTCAFGFVIRTQVIGDWQSQFNLSETEKGSILGVGFWPFAFSIFAFSLIIDKFGYGRAAVVGFILQIISTTLLVFAFYVADQSSGQSLLYWGTFVLALSCGTVEAYINPVVATMFSKDKTKWLNILHAGWPGGIVLAGIIAILMGDVPWVYKVGLTFIPTLIYGAMLIGKKFPVSERVTAGVTYREMLQDFGALGAFVAIYLITLQIFEQKLISIESGKFLYSLIPAGVGALVFGLLVQSFGRLMYFFLLLIMLPLATTELGIDSWITELMKPEMKEISIAAGWVLVYTAAIMMVLRFFAGSVVHRISPLGLLAVSSVLAIVGLVVFSAATGMMILVAATIYGVGKTFFWPTMLGVVSERFPKGGAVALNCIGGVGMLGLSVGMVFLGQIQDNKIHKDLVAYDKQHSTDLVEKYATEEKTGLFGAYNAINQDTRGQAPKKDVATLDKVEAGAKKSALLTAAIFPVIMLVCYLILIFYFKSKGGYKPVELDTKVGGA